MSEAFSSSSLPVPRLVSLFSLVAPKLARVECEIERNLRSDLGPIHEAGTYLSGGGGKLIRPSLLLLVAGMLGYEGDQDVNLGAVFELIHTATLVHDDIIDEADTRRGRPALNRIIGNEMSILQGDYLYIRSMNMALFARKIRVIDLLAESTERMIEGEIMAHHIRGRSDVTAEQHMEIIRRKTAWLFSGCCRVAGVLADVELEREHRLGRYGMELGIAFQLVDDLLDLTADEATLGKPVASDLREGRLTLPWIDLMACGSEQNRRDIASVLEDGSFERCSYQSLHDALEHHGCLARCQERAERHADNAREALRGFAGGAHRDVLGELPDMVLRRDR